MARIKTISLKIRFDGDRNVSSKIQAHDQCLSSDVKPRGLRSRIDACGQNKGFSKPI